MTWYRVFGGNETLPEPADLAGLERAVVCQVVGDEAGWQRLELRAGETIVELERWLVSEDGIRAELNSWAAAVEASGDSPQHAALMERLIQAKQLITLSSHLNGLGPLVQHLAQQTNGIYQVDGEGFYSADGVLLVAES